MASPIARRPAGLLDLLLTQQQGRNPDDLLDTVQPVLDITKFYDAERVETKALTTSVSALGGFGGIGVDAGQVWKVYGVAFFNNFATVNQRIGIAGEILNKQVSDFHYHNFGIVTATGATDVNVNSFMWPNPVHWTSGDTFRGRCTSINLDAQPNISVTMQMMYVRMEA